MIAFRTYNPEETRYGADYHLLRSFYLELDDIVYPYGRWDWMVSHSYLQEDGLGKIGLWLDGDKLVGVATYDTMLDGNCFFVLRPGYEYLCRELIVYAEERLAPEGAARLLIRDGDTALQRTAAELGYFATQSRDCVAVFDMDGGNLRYGLPPEFSITSMEDTYDLYQYGRVLWKGFDHERKGEGPYAPTPGQIEGFRREFERPNVNRGLKIAVVDPEGNFAAYCGMWQDDASESAMVEPVATDPAYRRMGLGRAAVLEAIRRCGLLGAKRAYVGSSQQFYYQIGFRPCVSATFWERKRGAGQ